MGNQRRAKPIERVLETRKGASYLSRASGTDGGVRSSRISAKQGVSGDRVNNVNQIIHQDIYVNSGLLDLYFDIHLLPNIPGADSRILEPGRCYSVQVASSYNKSDLLDQNLVRLDKGLELFLEVQGSPAAIKALNISDQNGTAYRSNINSFKHEFHLEVNYPCPIEGISLVLTFRELGSGHRPRPATYLPVHLAGNFNLPDPEAWGIFHIDPEIQPPDNLVMLFIIPADPGYFRLKGWGGSRPLPWTDMIGQPELDIDDPVYEASTDRILNDLFFFSQDHLSGLIKWLRPLQQKYEGHLSVVIAELFDSRVFWEMVQLSPGQYLGAVATVVRWIPLETFGTEVHLRLRDEKYSGVCVAYVDNSSVSHNPNEAEFFSLLSTTLCTSTRELEARLFTDSDPVGLVYIGCRGIFIAGDEPDTARWAHKREQVVKMDLQRELPVGKRPLLFVNSDYSARVSWNNRKPFGMVKNLLARIADGYIGTLGPIAPSSAKRIAKRFFQLAYSAQTGNRPAELLRQIRAEATQNIAEQDSETAKRDFIATFQYIFFGNPLSQLVLQEPEVRSLATLEDDYDGS